MVYGGVQNLNREAKEKVFKNFCLVSYSLDIGVFIDYTSVISTP